MSEVDTNDYEVDVSLPDVINIEVETSLPLVKGEAGTIEIDTEVTKDSDNAVSSGGVYDALQEYPTKNELEKYFETENIKVLDKLKVGALTIYKTTKTDDDGTEVEAGYIYTDRGNIYTTNGDIYSSDGDVYAHRGKVYAEETIYSRNGDFEAHNGSFYKGDGDDRTEVAYKDELESISYEQLTESEYAALEVKEDKLYIVTSDE